MRSLLVFLILFLGACAADRQSTESPPPASTDDTNRLSAATSSLTTAPATTPTTPPTTTTTDTATTTLSPFARPDWLGTRVLPLRADDFGEIQPTPDELRPRALATLDDLAAPTSVRFESTVQAMPADVLARSTWRAECPVTLDELRYLTLAHWGFDGELHTGELIVNAAVADDIVGVFQQLFDARFPIEQMRVIAADELDEPPTGDGNDTTSFVCRPAVGSTNWSQHAYGLAVDINPFHNPYQKGDLVLPELASYYLDRTLALPGMISDGDVVARAFFELGWGWGGNWRSLEDYMHFSQNGH